MPYDNEVYTHSTEESIRLQYLKWWSVWPQFSSLTGSYDTF